MKNTGRFIGILLSVILTSFSMTAAAVAAGELPAVAKGEARLRPDYSIVVNGTAKSFYNAKGDMVYPVVYRGSTYLPVRAVSEIMGEDIQWVDASNTIFIGKTMQNPNKLKLNTDENKEGIYVKDRPKNFMEPESVSVTVGIRPDFNIMYDFVNQFFKDAVGNPVYAIVYEGSTYLPIRAAAGLMEADIQWDAKAKIVDISTPDFGVEEKEIRGQTLQLQELFDKEAELNDSATKKLEGIQKADVSSGLLLLATSVSADSQKAGNYTAEINNLKTRTYTEEELAAHKVLCEFAKANEQYILILENIAYLVVSESDYSILAETFYNSAREVSFRMDRARDAIDALRP